MPRLLYIKPMGPWEFGWRPPEPRKTWGPCPCGVDHDLYFGNLAGREDIDPRGPPMSVTSDKASELIHKYGRDGALKACEQNIKNSKSEAQEAFWERVAELIEEACTRP